MDNNISVFEKVEIFEHRVNHMLENISLFSKDEKENIIEDFSREYKEISYLLNIGDNMLNSIKYSQLLPMLLKTKLTKEQWTYILTFEKLISAKKEELKKMEVQL